MKTKDAARDLDELPGHYIRRLHQIAVAIFLQETEAHGLTPVQFAALHQAAATPGVDQRTLARSIGLDTSTTAGVTRPPALRMTGASPSRSPRTSRR